MFYLKISVTTLYDNRDLDTTSILETIWYKRHGFESVAYNEVSRTKNK